MDDVISLLEFMLTTTYFKFRGDVFQQKFGAAMGSPVSPIVANLFLEDLEERAIDTAPPECKPNVWLRYVDDVLAVVKVGKVERLMEHMNTVDQTGSIKFTYEEETEKSIPMLDTLITRKEDGSIKTTVYRKKTHTDQYLSFQSHHPLHQKLGVVRTLLDRCDNVITEEADKEKEEKHLKSVLKVCGYPEWSIKVVKENREKKKEQKKSKKSKKKEKEDEKSRGQVVLPYIKGVSEAVERVMKKHGVGAAMRPHDTLRHNLVHPKDKCVVPDEVGQLVYQIPCKNCESSYVGETGRLLKTRLEEHMKDAENSAMDMSKYTRSARKVSERTYNKSALSDYQNQMNHIIDWEGIRVLDREAHQRSRQVREAVWIRRTKGAINRDEGAYDLSHIYDRVIEAPSTITV